MAKWQTVIIEKLWLLGAIIVESIDWVLDQIAWGMTYFGVKFLRYIHNVRMTYLEYKRPIMHGALYFVITGVLAVFLFAHAIDYSYSYNGRNLGIVKEQATVLEILDLVSEELTQEYGLPIAISAESDITFKPVLSFGKELDTPDAVLKKFTYMGDIQTKGYTIVVDGNSIGTVESESVGQEVIQSVIGRYLDKKAEDYEFVGLNENVKIKEVDTVLSHITNKNSLLQLIDAGADKEFTYTAAEGDKVKDVAEKLEVSIKTLRDQNPGIGTAKTLKEGDVITVTRTVPILSVKTIDTETFAEVLEYETEIIKSDDYYEDEEFVRQQGSIGKQRVTARVTRINGEITEREDLETEMITEPVKKIIVKGTKKAPPRQGTGTFIRPVNGATITSYFGWRWGRMHEGIDFGVGTGTPVHASDGGTVKIAGWYYAYGLCVVIDHGGGMTTLYGHNSSLLVHVGDRVFQGQTIARSGSTGRSTGPHCHFEIRKNGKAQNPLNYLN